MTTSTAVGSSPVTFGLTCYPDERTARATHRLLGIIPHLATRMLPEIDPDIADRTSVAASMARPRQPPRGSAFQALQSQASSDPLKEPAGVGGANGARRSTLPRVQARRDTWSCWRNARALPTNSAPTRLPGSGRAAPLARAWSVGSFRRQGRKLGVWDRSRSRDRIDQTGSSPGTLRVPAHATRPGQRATGAEGAHRRGLELALSKRPVRDRLATASLMAISAHSDRPSAADTRPPPAPASERGAGRRRASLALVERRAGCGRGRAGRKSSPSARSG